MTRHGGHILASNRGDFGFEFPVAGMDFAFALFLGSSVKIKLLLPLVVKTYFEK